MANFHCAFQMISRQGGKSCVAALAYRSATTLLDQRTGEFWDYTRKGNVRHVDIITPDDAPKWVSDIAQECRSNRQSALQQYADIIEAAEKRKDSQVYRECEFSLPNELTEEQNIEWATAFVKDVFIKRGMVAVVNFHFDIDPETGMEKPHCHVLLSTRHLTEEGWGLKNRDWNSKELVHEAREQCSQYQNEALKKHGFDVQVTHLSYEEREIDIDAQPKLGATIFNMTRKGIETNTQKIFDAVRLKNQFKIVKDPEIVFEIVTSQHATFTRKDIAKVLNRYIDDADQFQILLNRLMASKELVTLQPKKEESTQKITGETKEGGKKEIQGETEVEACRREKEKSQEGEKSEQTREPVYTTKKMVRIELSLIKTAEAMALRKTHPVSERVINAVIAKYHKKFEEHGGLSADQEKAIRHMLSPEQISCVVGFAGAGKTTCLEAVREAFEEEGYAVLGLAPTGRAEQSIGSCGIRSMTVHRFLKSQAQGRERISTKTVVILDEAGMLDSRRFAELETIVEKAGAKIIPMGDNNQAQAVEAGAPLRLITNRIAPAVLETVVRQQVDWQREAGRLFGTSQPRKALKMYQENGCFHGIEEEKPDLADSAKTIDNYCLARQISGHIWKEMEEDTRIKDMHVEETRLEETGIKGKLPYFDAISQHQDYALHAYWKNLRYHFIQNIIYGFDNHKAQLEARGITVNAFEKLILAYKAAGSETNVGENREILFEWIENALRKMSYNTIVDTNVKARQALVEAWASDRKLFPDESHLMLAFTKENAHKLNEAARTLMREDGVITGHEVTYQTQSIEEDDFGVEHKVGHQRTFAKGDRILFTRNNKGLGVSNGTLGTIVFLRHGKIKVLLDGNGAGEEQKKVSFAPTLYPFFDNGWATTIRKSQSVTADHVKFLGTWEDYRNLAYVAMTRHRRTLQLFYSDLDFWRSEKVIDRLSRIREKLLGVDYLDAEKIQGHLKEDTDVLWHHRHHKKAEEAIQHGKDFWAAIKVTAKDVLETIFPPEEKKLKEEEEAFLSLEDFEEYRSRDFFKDLEAKEGEGHLPGEDRLPDEGRLPGKNHDTDQGQFKEASNVNTASIASENSEDIPDLASGSKIGSRKQSPVSQKSPQPKDPLTKKREQFEKTRLPINQEFCANLGFLVHHRRLPRTAKELDAAYWQGERLTAIEGRLYKEALKESAKGKDKTIDEKALTTRDRAELAQNQTAPRHVTVFGKASDLDKAQLKQLQQHALLHQDKTNQPPPSSDLESICQAIKAHGRMMEIEESIKTDGTLNNSEEQGASVTQTPNKALKEDFNQDHNQTPNTQQERSKTSEESPPSSVYKSLIEQQSLLMHIKDGSAETINRGGKIVLKDEAVSILFKIHKIQDSCSERLCRMNSEIQSLKNYSQEMKSLASRRQKERGFDM